MGQMNDHPDLETLEKGRVGKGGRKGREGEGGKSPSKREAKSWKEGPWCQLGDETSNSIRRRTNYPMEWGRKKREGRRRRLSLASGPKTARGWIGKIQIRRRRSGCE